MDTKISSSHTRPSRCGLVQSSFNRAFEEPLATIEQFSGGYSSLIFDQFKWRTLARQGSFRLPRLRPGLTYPSGEPHLPFWVKLLSSVLMDDLKVAHKCGGVDVPP